MRGPSVIYVGNLPADIKERELQELFEKVRKITRCWPCVQRHFCQCARDPSDPTSLSALASSLHSLARSVP